MACAPTTCRSCGSICRLLDDILVEDLPSGREVFLRAVSLSLTMAVLFQIQLVSAFWTLIVPFICLSVRSGSSNILSGWYAQLVESLLPSGDSSKAPLLLEVKTNFRKWYHPRLALLTTVSRSKAGPLRLLFMVQQAVRIRTFRCAGLLAWKPLSFH